MAIGSFHHGLSSVLVTPRSGHIALSFAALVVPRTFATVPYKSFIKLVVTVPLEVVLNPLQLFRVIEVQTHPTEPGGFTVDYKLP